MPKNHFILVKKLKNTESAQLWVAPKNFSFLTSIATRIGGLDVYSVHAHTTGFK